MFKEAYGAFDSKSQYFCDPTNIETEKVDYKGEINRSEDLLNIFKFDNPQATTKELSDYLLSSDSIKDAGKIAECLAHNNVEPDAVATFSPDTQEVLMHNYDKLAEIAPGLVQYATVPEIPMPILARLSVLGGAVGLYLLVSKLPYVKENVRKTASYLGDGIRKLYRKNK